MNFVVLKMRDLQKTLKLASAIVSLSRRLSVNSPFVLASHEKIRYDTR